MIRVFMLALVWGSLGLYLEIPGPTMIDIKIIFSATYEEVSRSVSGRGAGGFIGALIGGYLVERFRKYLDLLIALSETTAGLAIMLAPYTYTINTLWFHYFSIGICNGIISIAGIRSIITMWPEKAAVYLQILYLGYGIGALLAPLVVNPFLAVVEFQNKLTSNSKNDENFKILEGTRVHIAYIVIGTGTILLSVAFYRFHFNRSFCKEYEKVKYSAELSSKRLAFKEIINPATYTNGRFYYGIYILCVLFSYFFSLVGGLVLFGQFVRSFSVTVFNFTKSEASYLNMTFWLGFSVGRVVGSVLSYYIPLKKLFIFQVLMHLMSSSMLYIYASLSSSLLWYCTAFEGFLLSPLYPSGIAYANTLIDIGGMSLMIIRFAGSFGDFIFIWLGGILYDAYGPYSVIYILHSVGIVLFFCAICLLIGERSKIVKEVEFNVNR